MMSGPLYIVYIMIFAGCFLLMQVMIGAGRQTATRIRLANGRLRRMSSDSSDMAVIAKMRKSRSLNDDGELTAIFEWINTLVMQSGAPLGRYGIFIICAVAPVVLAAGLFVFKGLIWLSVAGGVFGLVAPIFGLKYLVKRRRNKVGAQLPEALDVIVRSLSAGHPVPVAMAMVGREMPDPIGSEFAIASDEISYGSSMGSGIQRMSERVGHSDFELFAATVRLQERTGGNLAELLRSNASTIRERQRMRLKIKAASAEGRMSALILNIAPLLLYIAVQFIAPDFYGELKGNKTLTYGLWCAVGWMTIGNLAIRKMISFRI